MNEQTPTALVDIRPDDTANIQTIIYPANNFQKKSYINQKKLKSACTLKIILTFVVATRKDNCK